MLGEGGYGTVHMATRKKHGGGKTAASATTPSLALPATAREPRRGDKSGDLSGSQDGEEGGVCVAIKKVWGDAVRRCRARVYAYMGLLVYTNALSGEKTISTPPVVSQDIQSRREAFIFSFVFDFPPLCKHYGMSREIIALLSERACITYPCSGMLYMSYCVLYNTRSFSKYSCYCERTICRKK